MSEILEYLLKKVRTKFLVYLEEGTYKGLDNSALSNNRYKEILDNKLYEVVEYNSMQDKEVYYLTMEETNIGWFEIDKPIKLFVASGESCLIKKFDFANEVNFRLKIQGIQASESIYKLKYVCKLNDDIFVGLEGADEFIGFINIENIEISGQENIPFKFNQDNVELYNDFHLVNGEKYEVEERLFIAEDIFTESNLGVVVKDGKRYFFKLNDTDLKLSKKSVVETKKENYFIDHVLSSMQIERQDELIEKSKFDKERYHKTCVTPLEQEIRDYKLRLKRSESKRDYSERLVNNQNSKIKYYQERNANLENRVELLEGKVKNQKEIIDDFKKSRAYKIHMKLNRK